MADDGEQVEGAAAIAGPHVDLIHPLRPASSACVLQVRGLIEQRAVEIALLWLPSGEIAPRLC